MRPLSNLDINHYYKRNPYYGGCVSKDQLKVIEPTLRFNDRRFWIVNLEDSSLPGSHWQLVCLVNPDHGIFFDSYSTPPPREILEFMKRHRSINYMNEGEIQSLDSSSCGWFCIYVSDMLLKGRPYLDVLDDFHGDDYALNESVLEEYFRGKKRIRP
jgi:Fe-S-cluster formation regulator IscX/YfhJ